VKRHRITPRPDWIGKVESVGFTYHSRGDTPGESEVYWDESVAYELTAAEVDTLEVATNELHRLCLAAVDWIVAEPERMERFRIPPAFREYVARSWMRRDPHLYGRFDLAFDPDNPEIAEPKLLEYNADTPTALLESAVVQWFWLEDAMPDDGGGTADQFNSIHERLIERWRTTIAPLMTRGSLLHLSSYTDVVEERQTVEYLADTAQQAGIAFRHVGIEEIGWDEAPAAAGGGGAFVDADGEPIRYWFKLYPWEWMVQDAFAPHLLLDQVGILEPPWKMLLSNKAILPVLWELFPDHPNLLPAGWDRDALALGGPGGGDTISKPILAREGSNIELRRAGSAPVATGGRYDDVPVVHQRAVTLPRLDGMSAVIGSWVIGDEAAGICIREDSSPIVTGDSRLVPHFFR
jgi:glutathionylspermidine synthase